jgi:starvation-inducible outer membrane lipoprotein
MFQAIRSAKMHRSLGVIFLPAAALLLSGCAGFIPLELKDRIQWEVSLRDLQRDLKGHKGQLVLLGGEILEVRKRGDEESVEVLQRPVDAAKQPVLASESDGRFVIKLSREASLEKGAFEGQPLTVVGEVTGESETGAGKDKVHPVLLAKVLRLWFPADYAPPPPYYYHEPYYYRPLIILRHK